MNLQSKEHIGNLDRRITLLSPSQSQTASGFVKTDSWTSVADRWAKVDYDDGREVFKGDRETAKTEVFFTVRNDSTTRTIDKTWRVQYDSKQFDITTITETGRQRFFKIETELRE
jgi:SPP1 family predicted phage head-tail adaptor